MFASCSRVWSSESSESSLCLCAGPSCDSTLYYAPIIEHASSRRECEWITKDRRELFESLVQHTVMYLQERDESPEQLGIAFWSTDVVVEVGGERLKTGRREGKVEAVRIGSGSLAPVVQWFSGSVGWSLVRAAGMGSYARR